MIVKEDCRTEIKEIPNMPGRKKRIAYRSKDQIYNFIFSCVLKAC